MIQTYLASLLFIVPLGAVGTYDLERPSVLKFASDGFDPSIGRGEGKAIEKIYYRFGQARRVDVQIEPDAREPGVTNEVKTWHYDGLEIITSGSVLTLGRWIDKITLTSPKYKLKFGLSIGLPREAFIAKLGQPSNEGPKAMGYWAYYHTSAVNIWFDEEDQAEKITWEYFAD